VDEDSSEQGTAGALPSNDGAEAAELINDLFGRDDFTEVDILRWQLRQLREEHKKELEPGTLQETVQALWRLANRAIRLNTDRNLEPGLELVARTLSDLMMLGDGFLPDAPARAARDIGDTRERHLEALDREIPVKLGLHVYEALDGAALLPEAGEDDPVQAFRQHMGARLRRLPGATDDRIKQAVSVFRSAAPLPKRAAEIADLMDTKFDVRTLHTQRADRDARLEALGVKTKS